MLVPAGLCALVLGAHMLLLILPKPVLLFALINTTTSHVLTEKCLFFAGDEVRGKKEPSLGFEPWVKFEKPVPVIGKVRDTMGDVHF